MSLIKPYSMVNISVCAYNNFDGCWARSKCVFVWYIAQSNLFIRRGLRAQNILGSPANTVRAQPFELVLPWCAVAHTACDRPEFHARKTIYSSGRCSHILGGPGFRRISRKKPDDESSKLKSHGQPPSPQSSYIYIYMFPICITDEIQTHKHIFVRQNTLLCAHTAIEEHLNETRAHT